MFVLQTNDKSGQIVSNNAKEIIKYTNLYYLISSKKNYNDKSFYFKSNKIFNILDSIYIMTKFYPWIINYSFSKNLNPDKPRYLRKITQTF